MCPAPWGDVLGWVTTLLLRQYSKLLPTLNCACLLLQDMEFFNYKIGMVKKYFKKYYFPPKIANVNKMMYKMVRVSKRILNIGKMLKIRFLT